MIDGNASPDWLGTAWHGCGFDGAWREGASQIQVAEPATGDVIATPARFPF